MRCAVLLSILVALGCSRARPAPPRPHDPGITIDLTPEPDGRSMRVEIEVAGPRAHDVRALGIARSYAGTLGARGISKLEVADARGAIAVETKDGGDDTSFDLARPPEGDVIAWRYRALAPAAEAPAFALQVGPDRATAIGHAFLVLPRLGGALPAHVRWHLRALGSGVAADSSLGSGEDVTCETTTEELALAAYVAGKLTSLGAGEGVRISVLGAPAVDPARAMTWSLTARKRATSLMGHAGEAGGGERKDFAFFFVGAPGLAASHDGIFLGRSFGVWFDGGRALDADLEILAMHELLHAVFGGAVRLGDAAWFTEGFSTHYARKILFDTKEISASDFAADLGRTAERGERDDYRRGAMLAAWLDHALAAKGSRYLDDMIRELAERGKSETSNLPASALRDLVARDLGEPAAAKVDRVAGGESIRVPDDVFGPCFTRGEDVVAEIDLGFDPASLDTSPAIIRGLEKGSAADRAGVREGAIVIAAKVPSGADDRSAVDLTLSDRRGGKRVRYHPPRSRRVTRWKTKPCPR